MKPSPPNKPDPSEAAFVMEAILLDLQMPGMDGCQAMEGLKDIKPNGYLPVLVITAQPVVAEPVLSTPLHRSFWSIYHRGDPGAAGNSS